jgi:cytochrome b561
METKYWSMNTRFLHLGLVATVTAQLFISLVMSAPDERGTMIGKLAYDAHELVGLTALGIVILHWIWSISSQADGGLKRLFPWQKDGRKTVIQDIKFLSKGRFSETSKHGGLSSLVHGLGFLAVTGAAITGAVLFLTFPETGKPGALASAVAELHEGIVALVWTYWIAHGGVAILHHLSGSNIVKQMFNLSNSEELIERKTSLHSNNIIKH